MSNTTVERIYMMGNWSNSDMINWMTNPRFGFGMSLLLIWGLVWKALALWRAAKEDSKPWFVALLLLQTWGLAEMIYLFFFAKQKLSFSSTPTKKSTKK